MVWLPSSSQWGAVLMALAGATVQYIIRPWMWIVYPLPKFWAILLATMSQESAWDTGEISGDNGTSWGLFQFNDVNNVKYAPTGDTSTDGLWRLDPWSSGSAAARYMSDMLFSSPVWWLAAVPLLGYPMTRWAWTHGNGGDEAAAALTGGFGLVFTEHESRGLQTFAVWSLVLWSPVVVIGYLYGRRPGRRRGRK